MESSSTSLGTSLPEILEQRAQNQPDALAFRFLPDGTSEQIVDWSYAQLSERAAAVAAQLAERGITRGRVVLALDPGLDYVAGLFGILRAGCTAVPSFPPIGRRAMQRFVSIVEDCAPGAVLTDPRFAGQVGQFEEQLPVGEEKLRWIFPEADFFETRPSATPGPVRLAEQALLQYSSGSTGEPKGIVLSHDNLVSNCRVLDEHMGFEADRVGCSWLPPYHDMGLMGTILLAVHGGWPLVMLSPVHFVQDPYRWLKAITDHKVTISVGPNFAFDMCATQITDEELATLDLSTLRQVFCGSEPVSGATLDRFNERFGTSAGFNPDAIIPCYGLAEATLFVTGKQEKTPVRTEWLDKAALELGEAVRVPGPGTEGAIGVVSCGVFANRHRVVVVDPDTATPVPAGRVGEVWVSGANVAQGYLNRPELSASTFDARLAGKPKGPGFLRTGDLGFLLDGELYVTGRLKDVIIVAGRNLYPQDIEESVERAHELLRRSVAFSVPSARDEGEDVVVVAEFRGTPREFESSESELRDLVTAAVTAEHGVRPARLYFGPPGTILMTTSGKVRRRATRAAYLDGSIKAFRPSTEKVPVS
ncbi:fatty acyl-AMP ligase [Streptomyces sp. NA04227]|uniref:fatty acyl-AMP ligase n=1 Tax=Streptomyces sp. NA04227 TaxID=2742136 RepID=UPI001590B099|nr:fatty acyl-AMP ligase [Streptomyces sp. NA04227]QKW06576.1 fatty acyl-AMP ligase [Streptomyces sp. NA04227]